MFNFLTYEDKYCSSKCLCNDLGQAETARARTPERDLETSTQVT